MTDFDTAKDYSSEDAELLKAYLCTGDPSHFGVLYMRYMPLVYGLSLKYLGNAQDAEDAAMQIFEDLLPKVGRYEIREFRTWLWSVARNHCLQLLRKRRKTVGIDPSEHFMENAGLVHLLSDGGNEEALAALGKCLEKLPANQREAIRLFFFEKQSYADIADATLYDIKGVKSYIQNGKRNLKTCIEKQGVSI